MKAKGDISPRTLAAMLRNRETTRFLVALGVLAVIYESRPNVTADAAALCIKSGNAAILRGGSEALNSNRAIAALVQKSLAEAGLPAQGVQCIDTTDRAAVGILITLRDDIDVIVPRGGKGLIERISAEARVPVIKHLDGICHVYVDDEADLQKAMDIIINGKTTNIGVCNALDKVLIDSNLENWENFAAKLVAELQKYKVEILGDERFSKATNLPQIESDLIWYEEFLNYKIVVGIVDSNEEAVAKINKYCGGHSASIITQNDALAQEFMENVDTAAVYQNASTRFTDGGQFGLGGELAISTDKLHQRGPIGLQHLVTNKWYIYGHGQIR